jgi:hypothetical protein
VNETNCNHTRRPHQYSKCRLGSCGKWKTGEWSSCLCENSTQIRKIECVPEEDIGQLNDKVVCNPRIKPSHIQRCSCARMQKSSWKIKSTSEVSLKSSCLRVLIRFNI